MFKLFKQKIRNENGAASIETLGLVLVLLASLVFIFLLSAGFWNLSLLNTAASNASLAGQTLLNTDCSADVESNTIGESGCDQFRARPVIDQITSDIEKQLIFTTNFKATTNIYKPNKNIERDITNKGNSLGTLPKCWSAVIVNLEGDFQSLGQPASVKIGARSMGAGYQPSCPE